MSDTFAVALPSGAVFVTRPGENLLIAAQNANWLIRYGCRNGNCEVCEAQLLTGSVLQRGVQIDAQGDAPKILLCQCSALSDLNIALKLDPLPGSSDQSQRVYAQLIGIVTTADGVQLEFMLPAGRKPTLLAGQYAIVETEAGTLHTEIDSRLTAARILVITTRADANLIAGNYYHVRYPLGSGLEP